MNPRLLSTTGRERTFQDSEIIVSKTDTKGRLTYVNRVFMTISDFSEAELLGQPHSIIRHPDMPRCVFEFFWKTLQSGQEIFAYVKNRCKNGDHYWVFAHATPSFDVDGAITGYHSSRRVPNRHVLERTIIPLYDALLLEERQHEDRKRGQQAGAEKLNSILRQKDLSYDRWIFSLEG